jgi:hypothetical protein
MLSVTFLNCYTECHYAECSIECRYAECLSDVMLIIVTLVYPLV